MRPGLGGVWLWVSPDTIPFCRGLSGSVMLSCEGSLATPGAALGQP